MKYQIFATTLMAIAIIPLQAQYKAQVSPPTVPAAMAPQTDALAALTAAAGGSAIGQYNKRAVKMNMTDGTLTYLDPGPNLAGTYDFSEALGTDDVDTVGYASYLVGSLVFDTCIHWDENGTAVSYLASGFMGSYCHATSGGQPVGYVENYSLYYNLPDAQVAALWTSPTTFIDLHTGGNNFSDALGTSGNQQVGYQAATRIFPTGTSDRGFPVASAYLWHGGPGGAINLTPPGSSSAIALATNGTQQAGWAYNSSLGSGKHATLWSGTAASAVDLNPAGWFDTRVSALSGSMQIGDGYDDPLNGNQHALIWWGTAASMVDLNQFLPLGYTNAVAKGADSAGNIVGYAWTSANTVQNQYVNVIWVPQPASPSQLISVTAPASVNQGDTLNGRVFLSGPAPSGGQVITLADLFSFGAPIDGLMALPASVTVLEGHDSAPFAAPVSLTYPGSGELFTRIYATDGTTTHYAPVNVFAVGGLTGFAIPSVAGGSSTPGTLTVSGFGQTEVDTVSLVSGNPALLSVPATVSIALRDPTPFPFAVSTSVVTAATVVPVTASLNGSSITVNVTLTPPVPAVLSTFSLGGEVTGGGTFTGRLGFSSAGSGPGAVITLVSDNPALVPVPSTVTLPAGQTSLSFTGVAGTTAGTAHVTASYNGVSLTASITVDAAPPPPVGPPAAIVSAEYWTISLALKITATTTVANSNLSYGTSPTLPAIGGMQFSNGVWTASDKMKTAPSQATVFNSKGGAVTSAITLVAK